MKKLNVKMCTFEQCDFLYQRMQQLQFEKNEAVKNEQTIRTFAERKQKHIDQLLHNIEQHEQKIVELEKQIRMLKQSTRMLVNESSQPTQNTIKTLKDFRNEMQALSQKYMKAVDTQNTEQIAEYESQMEKIDEAIQSHPEFIDEKKKIHHLWEEKYREIHENAFHYMLDKMQHVSTPQQKRRSNQLMILRKERTEIGKLHINDLCKMVASGGQGLCITELRGIYHQIHSVVFKSDNDGSKKKWREMILTKLKELTKSEENGQLRPHQKMNSAWSTETTSVPKKVVLNYKRNTKAPSPFRINDLLSKQLKKVT